MVRFLRRTAFPGSAGLGSAAPQAGGCRRASPPGSRGAAPVVGDCPPQAWTVYPRRRKRIRAESASRSARPPPRGWRPPRPGAGLAEHPRWSHRGRTSADSRTPWRGTSAKVELPLAPGKPQGARHTVEVLTDRREVAALADFIRQKRQHALRQGWRRGEQVVERGNGAQRIEVPGQGCEQHALIPLIIQVEVERRLGGARHVGNGGNSRVSQVISSARSAAVSGGAE